MKLGQYQSHVNDELASLAEKRIVERIWAGDFTVWSSGPEEIVNRLDWLNVSENMVGDIRLITQFAEEIKDGGYRHVVLLGIGGSSLGPESLGQIFGSAPGYPELIVLDSSVPDRVQAVEKRIDPRKTLFLVSSKSGTTIEPKVCYEYFRQIVEDAVGLDKVADHFIAITDPGTWLSETGVNYLFRRVFENPPEMGGRYSVLSYFGLVPAALIGIQIESLLDKANQMRSDCSENVSFQDNPGLIFGSTVGRLALAGVDKCTIIASTPIAYFGLWAEQLIAESLGKQGKGVVPITGEPALAYDLFGNDRMFVYLRLEGEDNSRLDRSIELLVEAGKPVITLKLYDLYDIGAEFFRWEFATAVAAAVIGVHPFDQPNVQNAKDITNRLLVDFESSGVLPIPDESLSILELLSSVGNGDYVAIMLYSDMTPANDRAIEQLRMTITERFGVATTFGYGPRVLHSTGQLHKGGPNSGVFIQLVTSGVPDISIPGRPYSFGILVAAQVLGDMENLKSEGRRVALLDVGTDVDKNISALETLISNTA